MMETVIKFEARPQMVGDYYEAIHNLTISELLDTRPDPTEWLAECTDFREGVAAKRKDYDPRWESLMWASEVLG